MIDCTSLEQELAELRRWKPHAKTTPSAYFTELVHHEFRPAAEQSARQAEALTKLLRFAVAHVPYYRELFLKLALTPEEIRGPEDLPRLPVLTKRDLAERGKQLCAEWLPAGEGPPLTYKSSGTTGKPATVLMSRGSSRMFTYLWHRQARWFRYDPAGRFAKIRLPSTMPRMSDGSIVPVGVVQRRQSWQYVGSVFETGPEGGFSVLNPIDQQIAWLQRFRPDYLMGAPGHLEELGLACGQTSPVESLQSLLAIASTVTPSMRRWIERAYGIPLHQNYGLNEVGIVAIRCGAGRYHVNSEHCLVEIVDAEGQPSPPGTTGHVLVTALQNLAMPLLRYHTGDIAEATSGLCPCGRTLPSFGEILGRYLRFAGLPQGTGKRVRDLLETFNEMPAALMRNLLRYQIYQDRENRFEVRLHTVGPLSPEFTARIHERWQEICGDPPLPLTITEGATIVTSPGGKHLDFDSAFHSEEDRAARIRAEAHLPSLNIRQ
jgi:phenylacetate-CoA ligase